ncbi:MAG: efflux RND transporter periplasmic adaptor subunit [Ignavibacteria bacterium]|nr:efflux RND transporter periplasmic adaptor subunit [Ignavibacteria bacterium]
MHPQIRSDKPGSCPICGMTLIPLASEEPTEDGSAKFTVKLSDAAMKIAEVTVSTVEMKAPYKEVYLPGKVMPDERKIAQLTARYPGRIEKLFINFTGQKVTKGQVLAKIYSPELVTAQRELFEAIKYKDVNPKFYSATRQKLKLWSLTEAQIDKIETTGDVEFYFDVESPLTGTVTKREVALGDYVSEGKSLFEIVDLSHVWIMFDAYENDIPWIKMGDKIKFTIKSIPGKEFQGSVTFIDPVLDPMARVARVRAELHNPDDLLKPEMLASGILKTMLPGSNDALVVPKSAVLWTGKQAVVYVLTNNHNNMFEYRVIQLGAEAGNYYVVKSGLEPGEQVASNGVFKIDAAAQLKGEKSMMNPEGGKVSMGHSHGSMGGDAKPAEGGKQGVDQKSSQSSMKMDMGVDKAFKQQLTDVYKAHLVMQQGFIDSKQQEVKKAVPRIEESLKNVDMSLVKGEMHDHWMNSLNALNDALRRIKSANSIETQRNAFADFSENLYRTIKMFGTIGETIYYQFCPMFQDQKGAYWLSATKEIKNPYYGPTMPTCGETKEIIAK